MSSSIAQAAKLYSRQTMKKPSYYIIYNILKLLMNLVACTSMQLRIGLFSDAQLPQINTVFTYAHSLYECSPRPTKQAYYAWHNVATTCYV
jgi:hypothetical protein